jgi:hypothetical protein
VPRPEIVSPWPRRASPRLRSVGSVGPLAMAALAFVGGLHGAAYPWVVLLGFVNLVAGAVIPDVPGPPPVGLRRWIHVPLTVTLWAGAVATGIMALYLVLVFAPWLIMASLIGWVVVPKKWYASCMRAVRR